MGGTVLDEIFQHGTQAVKIQIRDYDDDDTLMNMDFRNKNTGQTGVTLLNEQWHNEAVMTQRLQELGVTIERSTLR